MLVGKQRIVFMKTATEFYHFAQNSVAVFMSSTHYVIMTAHCKPHHYGIGHASHVREDFITGLMESMIPEC